MAARPAGLGWKGLAGITNNCKAPVEAEVDGHEDEILLEDVEAFGPPAHATVPQGRSIGPAVQALAVGGLGELGIKMRAEDMKPVVASGCLLTIRGR